MAATYHVYFTAKEGVTESKLVEQVHKFMDSQLAENLATGYQLLRFDNKATFQELPDYHLMVDYRDEQDRGKAFESMKKFAKSEPHSSLMRMVSDFKVAFSIDERRLTKHAAQTG